MGIKFTIAQVYKCAINPIYDFGFVIYDFQFMLQKFV